jgi:hypothetical protein
MDFGEQLFIIKRLLRSHPDPDKQIMFGWQVTAGGAAIKNNIN